MFTFYVYKPHGKGWKRLINVQADSYQHAARTAHESSGAKRIKIGGEDAAARCSMGYRVRIVRFEQ